MKVVDYLENGLTPILPDLPPSGKCSTSGTRFSFGPMILIAWLGASRQRGNDTPTRPVRELLGAYSVERRADKILSKLR